MRAARAYFGSGCVDKKELCMKESKFYKIYSTIDVSLSVIAFILLVTITFVGVIMRYFFNNPLIWQEEAQLACSLWICFMGGSYAFREKSHIAIDVLVDSLPQSAQKSISVIVYIVEVLVLAFVGYNCYKMTAQYAQTGKIISSLHIKMVYVYCVVPAGFLFMIISASLAFIDEIMGKEETN